MSVKSRTDSWHELGDRFDKSKNPNWTRICERIPGFKEFKRQQYQSLTCQVIIIG
ncbi:MAG: hypothetical protein AAGJ08_28295 [Cyanobacteria bacterium P01_H01_bin.35]